jgi:Predicted xylanase/chitin deacetylase
MLPRHLASVFALGLCLLTPLHARSPINTVKTDEPLVALTFDDGPHQPNTTRLLEILAGEDVRVTFFEIGRNVGKHPELARAIVAAGHEIGNHSLTHANLGKIDSVEQIRAELVDTQTVIRDTVGAAPVVFRAPFGSHGPALWTVLDELKLPSVLSALHVGDWEKDITTEQIVDRAAAAKAGDVVLLHTWQNKTLEAMPEIIRRLRAKGLRFVTVSELLASAKTEKRPAP